MTDGRDIYWDESMGDGDLARLLDEHPPHTTRLQYSRLGPGWQCECARCGRFGPHFSVERDAINVAQQHQERPGFPASGLDYGTGCPTC